MQKNIVFLKKNALSICLRIASVFSDETFGKLYHRIITKEKLNLHPPINFNDKVWWLKLNNRNPLLTKCSDKYFVREYVTECGLEHLLNKLYGVYKHPKDIDFKSFDNEVFLKCNHGSGSNIIFNPNKPFDYKSFVRIFAFQLKHNYYLNSREWNYKNIEPKIIAEEVLRDKNGNLPNDYKFLCFNGEPKLMFYDTNICMENGKKAASGQRNVYDMDFNFLNIKINRDISTQKNFVKPDNFEEMKQYAAILSQRFPHARVDFYNFDKKVYFGEITFYNHGGVNTIRPVEWNKKLGDWIDLEEYKEEMVKYDKSII